jgi:DNA-3-methyladenine glycosylase II
MYLIFNLQRPDVWPTGDLAVRVGVSRILGASERLTEAELEKVADAWRPHRSAVALLAWHFYSNAPDI